MSRTWISSEGTKTIVYTGETSESTANSLQIESQQDMTSEAKQYNQKYTATIDICMFSGRCLQ